MSICVRYVDCTSNCIRKDCLEFVVAHDIAGEELSYLILQRIGKFGLQKQYLVGESYKFTSIYVYLHNLQFIAVFFEIISIND